MWNDAYKVRETQDESGESRGVLRDVTHYAYGDRAVVGDRVW
jgi:hypothetical protein